MFTLPIVAFGFGGLAFVVAEFWDLL